MGKGKFYLRPKYEKPLRISSRDWQLLKFNPLKGRTAGMPEKYSIYYDKTNKEYYYGIHPKDRKHKIINSFTDVNDTYKTTQSLNHKEK